MEAGNQILKGRYDVGEIIIELNNLSKTFEQKSGMLKALDETSFKIHSGEFICLLGPSGCGKSTILNIIAQLDKNYSGTVKIHGKPLGEAKLRVGYIFQEPRLLPWLTIEENLVFAMKYAGIDSKDMPDHIQKNLSLVGLRGFEKSHPHQLSGGMQQRAAVARAFCTDPEILLLDEPFSGLDEITARSLRKELVRIWEQTGKTILFVTHNWAEATFLSDRILMMCSRPGKVIKEFSVPVNRPRDYEDTELFKFSSFVVKEFLETLGEQ
ncbi:MAG: ABC transporter ATP-binding protein [Thermincola sp.]|jgi:ABC-type nitrate/sulfonate/bicarbonate transport system ATPase subunit|nr:ABC transporter ATP-binding protein [Thermincola sp.]MDT3701432.1 ABC transporter ATP-binding protein [Thermincola sp.]